MLVLPIKKKWFDMIKSGEKKEEYREIKPYYESRLYHMGSAYPEDAMISNFSVLVPKVKEIIFRNGYSKNSPMIKCNVDIYKGYGKKEWGAEPNKEYYVIKILSVEEVK